MTVTVDQEAVTVDGTTVLIQDYLGLASIISYLGI